MNKLMILTATHSALSAQIKQQGFIVEHERPFSSGRKASGVAKAKRAKAKRKNKMK